MTTAADDLVLQLVLAAGLATQAQVDSALESAPFDAVGHLVAHGWLDAVRLNEVLAE
ncbi:MAG: hypothetical protein ACO3DQ_10975 [Cephaloticoccus sp.]